MLPVQPVHRFCRISCTQDSLIPYNVLRSLLSLCSSYPLVFSESMPPLPSYKLWLLRLTLQFQDVSAQPFRGSLMVSTSLFNPKVSLYSLGIDQSLSSFLWDLFWPILVLHRLWRIRQVRSIYFYALIFFFYKALMTERL